MLRHEDRACDRPDQRDSKAGPEDPGVGLPSEAARDDVPHDVDLRTLHFAQQETSRERPSYPMAQQQEKANPLAHKEEAGDAEERGSDRA